MKSKHVYLAQNLAIASTAVSALREAGFDDEDIALVARADIEMERIPDDLRDPRMDFAPAALRGAAGGGAAGLLAGLVAAAIPPLGVTLAGAAALAAVGAATGTWAGSLVGSAIPDPVRRRFEAEIEAGRILVVVDAEPEQESRLDEAMVAAGAVAVPHDESVGGG